ncbi:hypothetical protein B0919_18825 [Hymenobacter sp. CRA2]|nr:hypothetical protein B0919_18825 [Hymenobacter sp. CRA2]
MEYYKGLSARQNTLAEYYKPLSASQKGLAEYYKGLSARQNALEGYADARLAGEAGLAEPPYLVQLLLALSRG